MQRRNSLFIFVKNNGRGIGGWLEFFWRRVETHGSRDARPCVSTSVRLCGFRFLSPFTIRKKLMAESFLNLFLFLCFMEKIELTDKEVHHFLESRHDLYNRPEFVLTDPISIPRRFSIKEDIEIAGLFAAIIAWGNRVQILRSASRLIELFQNAPHEFVMHHTPADLKPLSGFRHRTFGGHDLLFFVEALKALYQRYGDMETAFTSGLSPNANAMDAITLFRSRLMETMPESRSGKHIANPQRNSAAKRLNMFLRWMVRNDGRGVDFGLWQQLSPSQLLCPLDVHSGRVARRLGLLHRKQDDGKAALELTQALKHFDPDDPVKYDFALFGAGIFEKIK